MNEIVDFLLACFESASGNRKYMAGIIAAKRLLKRHRRDDIMNTTVSIKKLLDYDFIKGIKRGLSLYS